MMNELRSNESTDALEVPEDPDRFGCLSCGNRRHGAGPLHSEHLAPAKSAVNRKQKHLTPGLVSI
jgi:hypothetical protein